ncbi:MAG: hypothetical protein ABEI13_03525 [Candidatus Paceibacteria bacterium]
MKKVLFFSRDIYAKLFAEVRLPKYDKYHVVRNVKEKKMVTERGGHVVGCLEEEYSTLCGQEYCEFYLKNGYQPSRYLNWLSFRERKEVLSKEIDFVRKVLSTKNYFAVVHETVSSEIEEIISLEAKRKDIHDVTFINLPIKKRFLLKDIPYSSRLGEKYAKATPNESQRLCARKRIEKIKEGGLDPVYVHRGRKSNNSVKELINSLSVLKSKLKRLGRYMNNKIHKYNLNIDWRVSSAKERSLFYPDYFRHSTVTEYLANKVQRYTNKYSNICLENNTNYVLYPMQVTPEASVRYFSPDINEHTSVIRAICRVLPMNTKLVVKEHPNQKGRLMDQEFIKIRNRNPNVCYLPADASLERLIKNAQYIVAISSTVGWEALVYDKPVLLFGDVWYDGHKNVKKLDSFKNLRYEAKNIRPKGVTDEYNVKFLSKVLSVAQKGYIYHENKDILYSRKNKKDLAYSFASYLSELQ